MTRSISRSICILSRRERVCSVPARRRGAGTVIAFPLFSSPPTTSASSRPAGGELFFGVPREVSKIASEAGEARKADRRIARCSRNAGHLFTRRGELDRSPCFCHNRRKWVACVFLWRSSDLRSRRAHGVKRPPHLPQQHPTKPSPRTRGCSISRGETPQRRAQRRLLIHARLPARRFYTSAIRWWAATSD